MNNLNFKSLENTEPEDLAQQAYQAFEKNKELVLTINRGRSSLYKTSRFDCPVMMDENLRKELNENIAKPAHISDYYFKNLNGDLCFIDKKVLERFWEITKKAFPNLVFSSKRLGIIDTKTNVELMNNKIAPQGFISCDDKIDEEMKIWTSKWVYKLSSKKEIMSQETVSQEIELKKN